MSGTLLGNSPCPTCNGEKVIERLATPDEVDNGCELGIAFDPCPDCGLQESDGAR